MSAHWPAIRLACWPADGHFSPQVHSQPAPLLFPHPEHEDVTIGIALSGGGAKGFAHIGVLKALETAGVSADVVAGTSMGAVIGGLYATGYSSRQSEEIARERNWLEAFSDTPPRRQRLLEQRYYESLF
ncbi:MAG: patatin-like phospholipase family protein [Longimonas sp.]